MFIPLEMTLNRTGKGVNANTSQSQHKSSDIIIEKIILGQSFNLVKYIGNHTKEAE
jgi:hypothetical protein